MVEILSELQDYIIDYCSTNDISLTFLCECFGDENKFYTNNTEVSLHCVSYYADDIDDMKQFFANYIDVMWENCKPPMNTIVLYIKDIVDMDSWYEVIVGAGLFPD